MSVPFPYNSDDLLRFINGEEPIPELIQQKIESGRSRGKENVLKCLYDCYLMRENSARAQKEKRRIYSKQYHKDNKEKIKQYREDNKDKIKEWSKRYHQENKEKRNEYSKQYLMDNHEKEKKRKNDYYNQNKDIVLNKSRKYREANRDRILEANKVKMQCECGVVFTKNGKSRHYKTKAHLRTIEDFKKISDDVNEYLLSL